MNSKILVLFFAILAVLLVSSAVSAIEYPSGTCGVLPPTGFTIDTGRSDAGSWTYYALAGKNRCADCAELISATIAGGGYYYFCRFTSTCYSKSCFSGSVAGKCSNSGCVLCSGPTNITRFERLTCSDYRGTTYSDSCTDSSSTKEYFCKDSYCQIKSLSCTGGSDPNLLCTTCNMHCDSTAGTCVCNTGYTFSTLGKQYGCVASSTTTRSTSSSSTASTTSVSYASCSENDNGIARFVSGNCIDFTTTIYDTCLGLSVNEQYCDSTTKTCKNIILSCSQIEAGYIGAGTIIQNMHCSQGECVCNSGYADKDANNLNGCEALVTTTSTTSVLSTTTILTTTTSVTPVYTCTADVGTCKPSCNAVIGEIYVPDKTCSSGICCKTATCTSTNCATCIGTGSSGCGWCLDSGKGCMAGSATTPTSGSCNAGKWISASSNCPCTSTKASSTCNAVCDCSFGCTCPSGCNKVGLIANGETCGGTVSTSTVASTSTVPTTTSVLSTTTIPTTTSIVPTTTLISSTSVSSTTSGTSTVSASTTTAAPTPTPSPTATPPPTCNFERYDWAYSTKGCCARAEQCYVGGNSESSNDNPDAYFGANKPKCIKDGQFILDRYCSNGVWVSRTAIIAGELLKFVDSNAIGRENYTLICDNYTKVFNNYEYVPVMSYLSSCQYKNTSYSIPCLNSVCVLRYGTSDGYKVIAGTALNWKVEEILPYPFTKSIDRQPNYCDSVKDSTNYAACSSKKDVWYNSKIQAVFFANESFSLESTAIESIINFIKNPFSTIVRLIKGENPEYKNIENTKLDTLYLAKLNAREISGFIEKGASDQYLSIVFKNFNTDLCAEVNRIKPGSCLRKDGCSYFITAQKFGNDENKIFNAWPELTARLRIKEVPSKSTALDHCNDCTLNFDEENVDCGGSLCAPCPCIDNDQDGYNITGGRCGEIDCNDANPNIHPNAIDNCRNGIDENCDGSDLCPVSCVDGIQNNGETGLDCGGPCPPCEPETHKGCQGGKCV
ncbi:MAG: putative metal-binding motif-containing protein, partial [Candidatus Woesearchaeota archaeon]|nr:putative metal-binding motif-containing protein [Candidatus Woesearchaeota archaeon]